MVSASKIFLVERKSLCTSLSRQRPAVTGHGDRSEWRACHLMEIRVWHNHGGLTHDHWDHIFKNLIRLPLWMPFYRLQSVMKSQCDIINGVSRMITGIMTSKCDPINFLFRTAALFCHGMCRVTENGQKSDNSISIDLYHKLKGILPQKIFYCLNLIFWIVMGCGIARFGRRGLKTT